MYINHYNGNLHSGQWLLFKLSGDKVYNFHIKYLMLRSVLYKNVLIRSRTNKKTSLVWLWSMLLSGDNLILLVNLFLGLTRFPYRWHECPTIYFFLLSFTFERIS